MYINYCNRYSKIYVDVITWYHDKLPNHALLYHLYSKNIITIISSEIMLYIGIFSSYYTFIGLYRMIHIWIYTTSIPILLQLIPIIISIHKATS